MECELSLPQRSSWQSCSVQPKKTIENERLDILERAVKIDEFVPLVSLSLATYSAQTLCYAHFDRLSVTEAPRDPDGWKLVSESACGVGIRLLVMESALRRRLHLVSKLLVSTGMTSISRVGYRSRSRHIDLTIRDRVSMQRRSRGPEQIRDMHVRHLIMKTALHENEFMGITFFLNCCPMLEHLTIEISSLNDLFDYEAPFDFNLMQFWIDHVGVYKCLRSSLKVVEINGFTGTMNQHHVLSMETGQFIVLLSSFLE
ncbi:putative F-box protein, partial [Mucuna pruriens]